MNGDRSESLNKKTVIFDFDGTLANTFQLSIDLMEEHGKSMGIDLSDRELIEGLRNYHLSDVIKLLGVSSFKLPFMIKNVRNKMAKIAGSIKMFEGMYDVLQKLKSDGYTLGILTSNLKITVKKFLKANNADFFDFVVSENNLFGKDNALKKIMKRYDLKKDEFVYVGDEARDIEACKKVGIPIIAVTWGFNTEYILREQKADFMAKTPQEILLKLKYLDKDPRN